MLFREICYGFTSSLLRLAQVVLTFGLLEFYMVSIELSLKCLLGVTASPIHLSFLQPLAVVMLMANEIYSAVFGLFHNLFLFDSFIISTLQFPI